MINWWFGEGFTDPQYEENPKPPPKGVEKPNRIDESGKQMLKVLEEKGFIR